MSDDINFLIEYHDFKSKMTKNFQIRDHTTKIDKIIKKIDSDINVYFKYNRYWNVIRK